MGTGLFILTACATAGRVHTYAMTFEGDGDSVGGGVPPRREIPHYHGDEVRIVFFVGAIVLVVAQSTGAELPLSPLGSIVSAVLLVIAAGITNPAEYGIHWLNAIIAIGGALLFGTSAIDHYRAGFSVFDSSFVYIEALAILALVALYFTTRTIRGIRQRPESY